MTYTEYLPVSSTIMERFNHLLSIEAEEDGVEKRGFPTDTTLETLTAFFEDGCFADIKLCSGQSNFFGDNILFNKDGYELCVPDCFDSINDGDVFEFNYKYDTYRVIIVEEAPFFCERAVTEQINKYFVKPCKSHGVRITVGFNLDYSNKAVHLYTDRPGPCIGKGGETIEKFKVALGLKEVHITELGRVVY